MYCKNCRNKMPDGAAVCNVCGASQDVNSYVYAQAQQNNTQQNYTQQNYTQQNYTQQDYNQYSYSQPVQTPPPYNPPPYVPASYGAPVQMKYEKDTSVIKLCVIVTAVVMLVLSLIKGYVVFDEYKIYGYELLEGIFGEFKEFVFFPFIMTAFDLWIIISCIAMVSDQLARKYHPDSEYNALGGYGYMMSVIIAVVVNWLYLLYLNNDLHESVDVFSLTVPRIGILILALVNRFVFLPSYLSALRYNKDLKEQAHKAKKDAPSDATHAPVAYASKMPATASRVVTYWKCPKCGEENPTKSPLCKSCGTYK